ncbi:spore protease YyaC [Cytobacillus spongiae]|uniref:spore protease YyaC n=1 Tax=Cytobacillus spongiae TaxID=2901381 RepID=UPI001F312C5A|nr:spore protease YyaC [Cytobacillus spongiae]UII54537.1 spore protease YyaC [Cytobacillus spongiae]
MNTLRKPLNALALSQSLKDVIPKQLGYYQVVFLCIGTDRSTGDSLGPLVGSFLKKRGYQNVIGTINDTVHGTNIEDKLAKIPKNKIIIVIDSMLGKVSSIGKFYVEEGGLKPGAGVGKNLPHIGDFSIAGVVNVGGFLADQVLQNTELSVVLNMAEEITEAIEAAFPLPKRLSSPYDLSWKITS